MLDIRGIRVSFGDLAALDGADLAVADGEVVAVVGPSGSGKSTLLRVVAGLQHPGAGTISWDGRDLAPVAPHERRFGMVFQDFALFPHLDVAGNVGFGPRMQGMTAAERAPRVAAALQRVELEGYEKRAISTLSGGQAQRVALARALASQPRLLLFDEPLGSLDKALRDRLVAELRPILAAPDITALYVTHDLSEAFGVADRVAVMDDGRIRQVATPQELWRHPASDRVATLLGFRTIVDATVTAGEAMTELGRLPVPPGTADGEIRLVLRPDAFGLDPHGPLTGIVLAASFRGVDALVTIDVSGCIIEAVLPDAPDPGSEIRLRVDPDGVSPLPG